MKITLTKGDMSLLFAACLADAAVHNARAVEATDPTTTSELRTDANRLKELAEFFAPELSETEVIVHADWGDAL